MANSERALEHFYHTGINARDIDETVEFYQAPGLTMARLQEVYGTDDPA